MKQVTKLAGASLAILLLTAGCHVSETSGISINCGGGKPCTYGGTVSLQVSNQSVGVASADLSSALGSGYSVIVHVPDGELTYDSSSTPQATLTATTDTGYTSSIVVNLSPAGSVPSSLYSGYTAYTFEVQPSSQLTAWVNLVNSHISSTASVVTASSAVFSPQGEAGTYPVYAQVTSNQTGTISNGSASFTDPGSSGACNPGSGANKLSCGGGGTGM